MQRLAVVLVILGFAAALLAACAEPGENEFSAAALLDSKNKKSDAVAQYLKAFKAAPNAHFGELAKARAEVLLLQLGAQHLETKQWSELEKVANQLIEIDAESMAGNTFMGFVLLGKGQLDEVEPWLQKANGVPRAVTPPSDLAVEATALALFKGAKNSARSKLERSSVDEQFLKTARERLETTLGRERAIIARCAELATQNTEQAMATLVYNYPDRPETAKVRGAYAKMISAKLASVETIGPPTVTDPDPIVTLVGALERVKGEPEADATLAKIMDTQKAWETTYAEQLKGLEELIGPYQKQALDRVDKVIAEKCTPLGEKLKQGDTTALPALWEARTEAIKLIPSGLGETYEEHAIRVHKACTPQNAEPE